MTVSAASITSKSSTPRDDVLDQLTFLGWSGALCAIVAGLLLSFLLFGYFVIYYRNADMDFMVIYSALAMNAGHPQHYVDHPAYLTILTVKSWFVLLHHLGLLDAWTLPAIPRDAAGFELAMTQAVRAGRVLAFLIAIGCVAIFAGLSRLMFRDWRVALLATEAFALSGGVAVHSRMLRSELIAACAVIFALMILIAVGRRAHIARPLGLAAAAGLCVLGLQDKVQAILLIGALPLLILPFGTPASASTPFWRTPAAWLAAGTALIAAAVASWTAWPLISTGFDRALLDAAQFHPLLFNRFGVYQIALLLLILACMIAFAAIWKVSAAETVTSLFAVVTGAAIVLLLLLLDGLATVFARYTFIYSSARPTVFLTWLILPGIVYFWRRGERLAALQALLLTAAAVGIDAVGVRRGLKLEYTIFTDPLIVLAGAILLERLGELRFHKWAFPIAAALITLHVTVGQAEPVREAFESSGPQSICEWNHFYMPLLPVPWCPAS